MIIHEGGAETGTYRNSMIDMPFHMNTRYAEDSRISAANQLQSTCTRLLVLVQSRSRALDCSQLIPLLLEMPRGSLVQYQRTFSRLTLPHLTQSLHTLYTIDVKLCSVSTNVEHPIVLGSLMNGALLEDRWRLSPARRARNGVTTIISANLKHQSSPLYAPC